MKRTLLVAIVVVSLAGATVAVPALAASEHPSITIVRPTDDHPDTTTVLVDDPQFPNESLTVTNCHQ